MAAANYRKLNFINQRNEFHHKKLVIQPSFRAVAQTHSKWWTFEKPKNKRQMYGGQYGIDMQSKVDDLLAEFWS